MNLSDIAATVLHHQRSTPDLIAEALRQAILHGVFQEGQSLRQDEIATTFGVSRIPVREALRQLEVEGLVTFYPNRGAVVSVLTPLEAQEIGEIRVALETLALQLAMPHLTATDLEQAATIIEATEQTTDPTRWAMLNWEFHATLYKPAQRPRLMLLLRSLHLNVQRYVRLQITQMDDRDRSQKEHWQLLEHCQQQNVAAATEILQHHIQVAVDQLVWFLQQTNHPTIPPLSG